MTKINCLNKNQISPVKVKVIKAPITDSKILKQIIFARQKALVL